MNGQWEDGGALPLAAETPEAHWRTEILGHAGDTVPVPICFRFNSTAAFRRAFEAAFGFDEPALAETPFDPTAVVHPFLRTLERQFLPGYRKPLLIGSDFLMAMYAYYLSPPTPGDRPVAERAPVPVESIEFMVVATDESIWDALKELPADSALEVVDVGPPVPRELLPTIEEQKEALEDGDLAPDFDFKCIGELVESASSEGENGEKVEHEEPTLVAIIDAGIGFANTRFRSSALETRFEAFLAMDVKRAPQPFHQPCVLAGKQILRGAINQGLANAEGDDEETYRELGVLDPIVNVGQPLMRPYTHGSHVLDIASGYDYRASDTEERDRMQKRELLGVQLPREVVADTSGAFMHLWIKEALGWIFGRAIVRAINGSRGRRLLPPLVLNLSYGVTAGPADGNHVVEKALAQFVNWYNWLSGCSPEESNCHVVISAGNSYGNRLHARVEPTPAANDSVELSWRVQPGDKTASFVHVWLPPREADRTEQHVEVSVVPPCPNDGSGVSDPSVLGRSLDWNFAGKTHARIYHALTRPSRLTGSGEMRIREYIIIALAPTEADDGSVPLCPAGEWRIQIKNKLLSRSAVIEARIQRDDSMPSSRAAGRQSYFDDPGYRRFDPQTGRPIEDLPYPEHDARDANDDSSVRVLRQGTVNVYACAPAPDIVAVGGYQYADGTPPRYTTGGPLGWSARLGPDAAAVSDASFTHRGVFGTGTLSGSIFLQRGTSVAAPAFVRRLADYMAGGKTLGELLADIAADRLRNPGPQGPHGPYPLGNDFQDDRQGQGRLLEPEPSPYRQRLAEAEEPTAVPAMGEGGADAPGCLGAIVAAPRRLWLFLTGKD